MLKIRLLSILLCLYFFVFSSLVKANTSETIWLQSDVTRNGATSLYSGMNKMGEQMYKGVLSFTPTAKQVAKRIIKVGGGGAVTTAVDMLLDGVDWVLDPTNNQVKYFPIDENGNKKYVYWTHYDVSKPSVTFATLEQACNSFWAYYSKTVPNSSYNNLPKSVKGGPTDFFCVAGTNEVNRVYRLENSAYDKKEEKKISLETVAQQIISNANAKDKTAIEFVGQVADEIVTQQEKERQWEATKHIVASANANDDTDTSNPDKEKDDKPEPPKTCSNQFPEYKTCSSLHKFGFTYATKKSALERSGIIGSRLSKQTSWNTFCGKHGTHDNYRPTPKTESSRHSNFAGTISSCKCCIDSSSGAKIITIFKAN